MSVAYLFSLPGLILLLVCSGGNRLSDFLSPEAYWEQQQLAYTPEALRGVLEQQANVDHGQVLDLVTQLGDANFARRKAATDRLIAMGPPVRPWVEEAARSPDPEIAARSRQVLKTFPEDKTDTELRRRMAIRGLGELKDETSRETLVRIAESGQALEARLAAESLRRLDGDEESGSPDLEARSRLLARFPANTQALASLRPSGGKTDLIQAIQEIRFVQENGFRLLGRIGDVRIDRITVGVNREGIQDTSQLQVMMYLEGQYDSLRLARWGMEAFGLRPAREGKMIYLHRNHLLIWPMSDTRLVAVMFGDEVGGVAGVYDIAKQFAEPASVPLLNHDLQKAIGLIREDVPVWAAVTLPETHPFGKLEETQALRYAWLSLWRRGEGLRFRLSGDGVEEGAVADLAAKRMAQLTALEASMAMRKGGRATEAKALMKSIRIVPAGTRFVLQGDVPFALLRKMVNDYRVRMEMMRNNPNQLRGLR